MGTVDQDKEGMTRVLRVLTWQPPAERLPPRPLLPPRNWAGRDGPAALRRGLSENLHFGRYEHCALSPEWDISLCHCSEVGKEVGKVLSFWRGVNTKARSN